MNMKKIIINIVLAVTTVFALSACEDFLDTKNLTQKTTENFPETEKDAQEMVTAIYAHLLFESPETPLSSMSPSLPETIALAGTSRIQGTVPRTSSCTRTILTGCFPCGIATTLSSTGPTAPSRHSGM